jgi:hypothetical protein
MRCVHRRGHVACILRSEIGSTLRWVKDPKDAIAYRELNGRCISTTYRWQLTASGMATSPRISA